MIFSFNYLYDILIYTLQVIIFFVDFLSLTDHMSFIIVIQLEVNHKVLNDHVEHFFSYLLFYHIK